MCIQLGLLESVDSSCLHQIILATSDGYYFFICRVDFFACLFLMASKVSSGLDFYASYYFRVQQNTAFSSYDGA